MRSTFSWPCASCGEYNVIELHGKAGARPRCGFCFHPVQSMPSLAEESTLDGPPVILSDAWIGDAVVRPFFGAPNPGRSARSPRPVGRARHGEPPQASAAPPPHRR